MFSAFITCNDRVHVITLSHHLDHLRQFLRLMLQIIVHCYDKISANMRKTAQKCRMLPKVSCHLYNSDSLIFVSKLCHYFEWTVFRSVIDKNQLKIFFYNLPENLFQSAVKFLKCVFWIVHRNHNGIQTHMFSSLFLILAFIFIISFSICLVKQSKNSCQFLF